MAVNKLIQTHAKIKTAVFILLVLFPFLYMMMGTTVQAAEGGTENKHYTFKSTLDSIAGSDWGKEQRSDIRLINDDVYGTEADTVKESAQSPVPSDDPKPDSDKKPDDDTVKKPTAGNLKIHNIRRRGCIGGSIASADNPLSILILCISLHCKAVTGSRSQPFYCIGSCIGFQGCFLCPAFLRGKAA